MGPWDNFEAIRKIWIYSLKLELSISNNAKHETTNKNQMKYVLEQNIRLIRILIDKYSRKKNMIGSGFHDRMNKWVRKIKMNYTHRNEISPYISLMSTVCEEQSGLKIPVSPVSDAG